MSPTATIRLPGPLREHAGGRAAVAARGATVREVIDDLERLFPGMRFRLCEETGELRPFVNIFIEAENIRNLHGLATPVPEGATLQVLHSVAGGAILIRQGDSSWQAGVSIRRERCSCRSARSAACS